MNFEELQELVIEWGDTRGILERGDHVAQFLKTVSEVGELSDAIAHNDTEAIMDGVGDTLVTMILMCDIIDIDPVQCLNMAYREISQRTGKMVNGTFVKD